MASDACWIGELICILSVGKAADPRPGEEENNMGDDIGRFRLDVLGVLGDWDVAASSRIWAVSDIGPGGLLGGCWACRADRRGVPACELR